MNSAFRKYYLDVTRYNLGISILLALLSDTLNGIICFSTGGMLLALLSFKYFQNNQYYLYYNLGFTKTSLILKTWLINFAIAMLFGLLYQLNFNG